ncbi:hypothetical protein QWY90_09925 [Flavobacterium paronense]|uniref:Seryl-tRNA synthetase n=1 Tax=Flavobacterium paronense TaxID=1392775 RepID=A0ABV5GBM7_9FLAO|nr:hypothetical protein [Flavobacterium paronense]MDN3677633.1 hypothetical protein [Flavobacterium paronense]
MKKLNYYLLVFLLSIGAFANTPNTVEKNPSTISNKTEMPVEVKNMLDRLDEIKAMDKSEMKSSEKKELRKEVRAIKKSLKARGNGVYLSIGAIIIIILLLIILL